MTVYTEMLVSFSFVGVKPIQEIYSGFLKLGRFIPQESDKKHISYNCLVLHNCFNEGRGSN